MTPQLRHEKGAILTCVPSKQLVRVMAKVDGSCPESQSKTLVILTTLWLTQGGGLRMDPYVA